MQNGLIHFGCRKSISLLTGYEEYHEVFIREQVFWTTVKDTAKVKQEVLRNRISSKNLFLFQIYSKFFSVCNLEFMLLLEKLLCKVFKK